MGRDEGDSPNKFDDFAHDDWLGKGHVSEPAKARGAPAVLVGRQPGHFESTSHEEATKDVWMCHAIARGESNIASAKAARCARIGACASGDGRRD